MKAMLFGTFDGLHVGHIDLLRQAQELADEVVVLVAQDSTVEKVKGARPIQTIEERMQVLKAIKGIDKVIAGHPDDVYARIEQIRPDCIILGYDQNAFVEKLEHILEERKMPAQIIRAKKYQAAERKSSMLKPGLLERI
ncbi:adenylyltransferase/cytidyltransferase family protein [Candidatus Nomurabacteria bacterium]|nr:adenylyltransferase/cytidyltransferase family protein [Candidatus Nomurabacteria bacterium]